MEGSSETRIAGRTFDFSRLRPTEGFAALSSVILILSMFLEWYTLSDVPQRASQDAWVCGAGNFSCNAWQTFSILDLMTAVAAIVPLVLVWIVVRGHKLSWPPGELTAVFGIIGVVIVGYNGILDKPGPQENFGIGLGIGYWLALIAAIMMAASGAIRATEQAGPRKPPGTL